MAGIANRPTDGAGSPETLPWAVAGTVLEPSVAQELAGWQPDPAPAPDYRLENWHRQKLGQWLERLGASALFAGSPVKQAAIGGAADAGDRRRLTINAWPAIEYETQAGDTNTTISQAFCALINASAAGADVIARNPGAGGFDLIGRKPGVDFTAVAVVLVDVGTANATFTINGVTGAPFAVRLGEDLGADLDFNFAPVASLDTAAKTFHFRKAKAAFRAGEFTGNSWANSNTGSYSAAFGKDTKASGDYSFAAGNAAAAESATGVALGGGQARATGGATGTVAIGATAVADGKSAVAFGDATASKIGAFAAGGAAGGFSAGAVAGGAHSVALSVNASVAAACDYGIAIGANAIVDAGVDGIAIGNAAHAAADRAVALGRSSEATKADAVALGGALAQGRYAVAIGKDKDGNRSYGTLNVDATVAVAGGRPQGQSDIAIGRKTQTLSPAGEHGAVAIGEGNADAVVSASDLGALATGGPSGSAAAFAVEAYGKGARAHGDTVRAEADYAIATGQGALAETRGERAHAAVAIIPRGGGDPVKGNAQIGEYHFVADVQGATVTMLDPANSNPADSWLVKGAQIFELDVVALWTENAMGGTGVAGDTAAWRIFGVARRDSGGTHIEINNLGCVKDVAGTLTLATLDAALIDADAALTIPPYYETNAGQFALKLEVDGSYLQIKGSGTNLQYSRFSAAVRYSRVQTR